MTSRRSSPRPVPDPSILSSASPSFSSTPSNTQPRHTYEEKSKLSDKEAWTREIKRRSALPENRSKKVEVRFDRYEDAIRFTIRDEGPGFDSKRFLDIEPFARIRHARPRYRHGSPLSSIPRIPRNRHAGGGNNR